MSTQLQSKTPRRFADPRPSFSKPWTERHDIQWQVSTFLPQDSAIGAEAVSSPTLAPGRQRRFDQPQAKVRPKTLEWTTFAANFDTTQAFEHRVAPASGAAVRATSMVRTDRLRSVESLSVAALTNDNAPQQSNTASEPPEGKYRKLLAEAAHDIRSPIASASQIVDAVSRRNAASSGLSTSDLGLLRIAQERLAQASNWTARILADQRLEGISNTQMKRRFYPAQWKSLMQPLLQFVAEEHGVRLLWINWERSLPKLYLDAELLSRSMLNIVTNAVQACQPGDQVSIRAGWSSDSASRFVIHVEDQGPGMPLKVLQALNGSSDLLLTDMARSSQVSNLGLGLGMTKRMVLKLGGNLTAQNSFTQKSIAQGAALRLSLPTDDLTAHLRAWLLRMDAAAPRTGAKRTFSLYGIRSAGGEPIKVDQQIANSVGDADLLYRFSQNGWLYYSARPIEEVRQSMAQVCSQSSQSTPASQLRSIRLATTGTHLLGGRQSDFGSEKVNLAIPAFAEQLFNYAQPLIRKAIPAVDDLHAELEAGFQSTLAHLSPKFAAPTRVDAAHAGNILRRPHTSSNAASASDSQGDGEENPQEEFARSLKRIAKNWRATQASMQKSTQLLSCTRNAS